VPYDYIYVGPTGEEYPLAASKQGTGWFAKTASGYVQPTFTLALGGLLLTFSRLDYHPFAGMANTQASEDRPFEPTAESDAGDPSQKRFGKWTVQTAVRHARCLSSEGFDELRRTDTDFRNAMDASEGIIVSADRTPNPLDAAQSKLTRYCELNESQLRHLHSIRSWAGEVRYALRINSSGSKSDALYHKMYEGTCACGKMRVSIPLVPFYAGDVRDCGCGIGDEYHISGRRFDGKE